MTHPGTAQTRRLIPYAGWEPPSERRQARAVLAKEQRPVPAHKAKRWREMIDAYDSADPDDLQKLAEAWGFANVSKRRMQLGLPRKVRNPRTRYDRVPEPAWWAQARKLREQEGLSFKVIGDLLGKNDQTVRNACSPKARQYNIQRKRVQR
jgi:hypothetical protein